VYTLEHVSNITATPIWQVTVRCSSLVPQRVSCSQSTVFCDVTVCCQTEISDDSLGRLPPFSGHKSKDRGNIFLHNARTFLPNHKQTLPKDGSHQSHHLQNTKSYFYVRMINNPGFHKIRAASGHSVTMLHKLLHSSVNICLISWRNDSKTVISLPIEAIHFFFFAVSTPGLGSTQPHEMATGSFSLEETPPGCESDHSSSRSVVRRTHLHYPIRHHHMVLNCTQGLPTSIVTVPKERQLHLAFLNHFLRFLPSFL